jgi:heme/copper-type cytochrome/quinol oxidase subunit 3
MILIESNKGYHTQLVQTGLKMGFWLFIVSEIMLFVSFFWTYFHYFLNPSIIFGGFNSEVTSWINFPPVEKKDLLEVPHQFAQILFEQAPKNFFNEFFLKNTFNKAALAFHLKKDSAANFLPYDSAAHIWSDVNFWPNLIPLTFFVVEELGNMPFYLGIPLKLIEVPLINFNIPLDSKILNPVLIPVFNTIVLLASAFAINIVHENLRSVNYLFETTANKEFILRLIGSILLGYVFLKVQAIEYNYALEYSWVTNSVWSIFYMLTGFHGFHVIVGLLFLQFNLLRILISDKWNLPLSRLLIPLVINKYVLSIYLELRLVIHFILCIIYLIHTIIFDLLNKREIAKKIWVYIDNSWYLTKKSITYHFVELIYYIFIYTILSMGADLLDFWDLYKPADYYFTKYLQFRDKAWNSPKKALYLAQMLENNYTQFCQKTKLDLTKYDFAPEQHFGFELAVYYWHFVDIIWIILFYIVYWNGILHMMDHFHIIFNQKEFSSEVLKNQVISYVQAPAHTSLKFNVFNGDKKLLYNELMKNEVWVIWHQKQLIRDFIGHDLSTVNV